MTRLVTSRRAWLVAALLAVGWALLPIPSAGAYPAAGTDEFDSAAIVTIGLISGPTMTETVSGPTKILRGNPHDGGDGRLVIETEIISMTLTGITPLGPVTVRESPTRHSTGIVREKKAGTFFPAESFFDVYVEIDILGTTFHNNDPIRMQAEITKLPPLQAEYQPPGTFIGVDLLDPSDVKVGVISHAAHFVGQKASFSVAPGGPSALNPATIFDVPTAPRILPPALGLEIPPCAVGSDNLDGLSYGLDFISRMADLRFSVDPASAGAPGTAVAVESAAGPPEAHGDEFKVVPPLPGGGSNAQVLDENGSTAPPFPLAISDDVDALEERPASFVDTDGDTVPDRPVYFSLDPSSCSLPLIPPAGTVSTADILSSVGGGSPSVFIPAAALGLTSSDDVDAFCLDTDGTPGTGSVLFSLAPGSPTLGLAGAGPSDLFHVTVPPGSAPPPPVLFPAAALGLLPTDNLNALKCLPPVELDYFFNSRAVITVEILEVFLDTVVLHGPTTVVVRLSELADSDPVPNGREQVQTEMLQMELRGQSAIVGPIVVRVRDPQQSPGQRSLGEIEEDVNNTPEVLDLPPFTGAGTATSFFDVFFEIELLDPPPSIPPEWRRLHNKTPKRMVTTITNKPPAPDETYLGADPVQLYDQLGNPALIRVLQAVHTPHPFCDPFDPFFDLNDDSDGDGIVNFDEIFILGTNPCDPDTDRDGHSDLADNCPLDENPSQVNSDAAIGNGIGIAGHDKTVPNGNPSDQEGDACETDGDADNDFIADHDDLDPGGDILWDDDADGNPCSPLGTDTGDDGPSWDSNCNGVLDCWEGPIAPVAAAGTDTDGDGLEDSWETFKWGTSPTLVDSDGDGLGDCKEAADVDGNGTVDFVGDVIYYAKAALLPPALFGRSGDFDIDGNNIVDFVGDVIQEAKFALIPGLCK